MRNYRIALNDISLGIWVIVPEATEGDPHPAPIRVGLYKDAAQAEVDRLNTLAEGQSGGPSL